MYFKVLFMTNDPKDDLQHIRRIMERSSRFISLSGLSGVMAGIIALLGAAAAYYLLSQSGFFDGNYGFSRGQKIPLISIILLAMVVLILAIGAGIWFTVKKSKKQGLAIWNNATRQLLFNLFGPLLAGGIFCAALLYHGNIEFLAPATLVFYGLALINASKFTFSDIQYLGYCEVFLGLVAMFLVGYGLVFWALGFGVLHIVYGLNMYKKYK